MLLTSGEVDENAHIQYLKLRIRYTSWEVYGNYNNQ